MRAARDLAEMAAILVAVGAFGFPLVRGLRDLSRAELVAWSWVAGLLSLCGAEAVLGVLGIRPAPWKLWVLVAAAALAFRSREPGISRIRAAPSRIGRLAWAIALAAVALFAVQALSEPMWAWDFIALWGLKGKTLFLSGGLPSRFFHDPGLAFDHPSYPLLLPALFAGLSTLAGGWDSQALALLYPAFELATLLVIGGFLRRRCGPEAAAVAVVLTAGLFPLYQSFLVGLADIPMALGFVLVGCALLDVLHAESPARLRGLLLAALFCAGLKKEGAVFLLLLAVAALLVRARRRNALAAAAVLAAVTIFHQAAMRWLRGPVVDTAFQWSLIARRGLPVFLHRLGQTEGALVHSAIRPILPLLLAAALILLFTRAGVADLLLLPLGLIAALYAAAPAASAWSDAALFLEWTFVRIAVALLPLFFLVLGARISPHLERFSLRFSGKQTTMN